MRNETPLTFSKRMRATLLAFAFVATSVGATVALPAPADAASNCSLRVNEAAVRSYEDGRYLTFSATVTCAPGVSFDHTRVDVLVSGYGDAYLNGRACPGSNTCTFYGSIRDPAGTQRYALEFTGERVGYFWNESAARVIRYVNG